MEWHKCIIREDYTELPQVLVSIVVGICVGPFVKGFMLFLISLIIYEIFLWVIYKWFFDNHPRCVWSIESRLGVICGYFLGYAFSRWAILRVNRFWE